MARKGNGYQKVAQIKNKKGSGSRGVYTPVYASFRPEGANYSPSDSGDVKTNSNSLGKIILKK